MCVYTYIRKCMYTHYNMHILCIQLYNVHLFIHVCMLTCVKCTFTHKCIQKVYELPKKCAQDSWAVVGCPGWGGGADKKVTQADLVH